MPACESYIVRIYRRDKKDPAGIVGLVEVVDTGQTKKFMNLDELGIALTRKTKTEKRNASEGGNI